MVHAKGLFLQTVFFSLSPLLGQQKKKSEFDSFKESRLIYKNNNFYMWKNMGKTRLNLIIKGITLLNLF